MTYKIYETSNAVYEYNGCDPISFLPRRGDLRHPAVTLDDLIDKINDANETIVNILQVGDHHKMIVSGAEV